MSRPDAADAPDEAPDADDAADAAAAEADGDNAAESDPLAALPPTDEHPVLLFDGVCNLCNSLVQFTVERDSDATIRMASLQSEIGQAILAAYGLDTDDVDSVVLVEDGRAYVKSEAALRATRYFDGYYPLLRFLRVLPRRVRDWGYDVVAANRYDWFGKKDQCMLPTGGMQERFLDGGVGPTE